ncbi:hypothetical protein SORBI_3001G284450 [Sorghum bicolor]|uniref:Uncharacterized protein n=1 Tax=Sorghum bicolor TaxID=4558 RepID=A0A1Z5S815_SORBI|nr:hypothetical protein SORBI_3001G284450 [Sorghum bicolor]
MSRPHHHRVHGQLEHQLLLLAIIKSSLPVPSMKPIQSIHCIVVPGRRRRLASAGHCPVFMHAKQPVRQPRERAESVAESNGNLAKPRDDGSKKPRGRSRSDIRTGEEWTPTAHPPSGHEGGGGRRRTGPPRWLDPIPIPIQPTSPGFLLLPRGPNSNQPRQAGPTRVSGRNAKNPLPSTPTRIRRGGTPFDISSIPIPLPGIRRTGGHRDAAARARKPAAAGMVPRVSRPVSSRHQLAGAVPRHAMPFVLSCLLHRMLQRP